MYLQNISGSMTFQIAEKDGHKYIEGIQEPKLLLDALRHFENVSGAAVRRRMWWVVLVRE